MNLQNVSREAVLERFPFLKPYLFLKAKIEITPVKIDLAHEYHWGQWDWDYEERFDIFLFNEVGEKIGTVGEVPKLCPAIKLFGKTLLREKMVTRKIPETVQEALNRVEDVFYILTIKRHSAWEHHEEAILHVPRDGKTANLYLAQLLEEARLKEELRLKRVKEERVAQRAAAAEEEKRKIQEAFDAEVARLDSLLREIKGH